MGTGEKITHQDSKVPTKSTSVPTSYSSYLKINELLSLQQPLSNPVAHDEMLFIITHQTYELWFKQVVYEMEALIASLLKQDLIRSFRILERICEIFRILVLQIDVLETMSPIDFNRFRSHLNPASGFQSRQFRELELLAGADPELFKPLLKLNPEWKTALESRMRNLSLRKAFVQLLASTGHLPDRDESKLTQTIQALYLHSNDQGLHSLCEYLIGFDEQFQLWRFRHVQMVERMIGMKRGTGGSLGVQYLTQTLRIRFFPELWEARTGMGGGGYGQTDREPPLS
jgi:tryptophan 2,3-dioxygenase